MPVYEYWCSNCKRKVTLYIRGFSETPKAVCDTCGSENLRRLFSTFAVHKTDMGVYDDILSDNRLVRGMMADDPRALAEWSRRMDDTSPGEMAPEHREMLERLDKGERAEKIIAEMQQREMASPEGEAPPETPE
jgi:putative FmdB family regulatory protein